MDKKDPFCWICHKCAVQISCSNCFRSYHIHCAIKHKEITKDGQFVHQKCKQCKSLDDSFHRYQSGVYFKPLSQDKLNLLFTAIIKSLKDSEYPRLMVCDKESLERYLPLSCKFINLYTVLKKAKKREYFSSEQVLADFHLINHNLLTATGLTCTRDIMSVKKFIEKAQEEFDLTNQCPHCIYKWYFEKYWFLTPCPWGHKLVLAKVDGHPFWPGKLLAYDPHNGKLFIRFFGKNHERCWIKAGRCYYCVDPSNGKFWHQLYSSIPNGQVEDFDFAHDELLAHIRKLKIFFPGQVTLPLVKQKWNLKDRLSFIDPDQVNELDELMDQDEYNFLVEKAKKDGREKLLRVQVSDVFVENGLTANVSPSMIKKVADKITKDGDDVDSYSNLSDISGLISPSILSFNDSFSEMLTQNSFDDIPDEISHDPLSMVNCFRNNQTKNSPENNVKSPDQSNIDDAVVSYMLHQAKNHVASDHNYFKQSDDNLSIVSDAFVTSTTTQSESNARKKLSYEKRIKKLEKDLKTMSEKYEDEYRQKYLECAKEFDKKLEEFKSSELLKTEKIIQENKKKLWCHICWLEAKFYCCYKAQYCSQECQTKDWPVHMSVHVKM